MTTFARRLLAALTHSGPGYDTASPTARHALTERVVARHIADNLTCGNPVAVALARSLQTELDAAGVSVDALVYSELGNQAGEQRAAGA